MRVSTLPVLSNLRVPQVRSALIIAAKLNRTLIMPQLWCGADRYWAPHDGHIPPTDFPLPFPCPMDHIFDLEECAPYCSMSLMMLSDSCFSSLLPLVGVPGFDALCHPIEKDRIKKCACMYWQPCLPKENPCFLAHLVQMPGCRAEMSSIWLIWRWSSPKNKQSTTHEPSCCCLCYSRSGHCLYIADTQLFCSILILAAS